MAVTNRDIKKATFFTFKKYEDLILWFQSKNPGAREYTNAKKLLRGIHIFKVAGKIGIAIDWASGRTRNTPWVAVSPVWVREVTKYLDKLGIEAFDIKNSIENERILKYRLDVKTLDKYVYVKNHLIKDLVESKNVEEIIKILTN